MTREDAIDHQRRPLTPEGNAVVAGIIGKALFRRSAEALPDAKILEALRKAVWTRTSSGISATARGGYSNLGGGPTCRSSRGRPTAS